jgi:hypothetical protein
MNENKIDKIIKYKIVSVLNEIHQLTAPNTIPTQVKNCLNANHTRHN